MENFGKLSPSEQEAILTTQPGTTPPNGTVPSFDNPPTRNNACILVVTICAFLVTLLASLRLYSRVFVSKVFKLEDCESSPAVKTKAGMAISVRLPLKPQILASLLIRTVMVINVVAYTACIIAISLFCVPIQKLWTPWIDGTCFGRDSSDIATAWVNLAIDTAILLLPQPIIWKLNMTRERKIGVSFIFSIGLLVVACAAGRIHSNMTLDYHGNTSHDASINMLWGFGEAAGVILVFSAPAVPKAFANQTFLAGVMSALRSWARLDDGTAEQGASSKKTGGSSWPPTIGGGGRKSPRKPTATEMDLVETHSSDYLELDFKPHTAESNGQVPETGILRTTLLESQDSASKTSTEPIMARHHPWMDD
ncbi:hypothetical protein DL771_006507 [Monosporascus sp. 5C6A]|nr:hypothetical protein DL771_006507 [Monosporascus sp. 5C6A]